MNACCETPAFEPPKSLALPGELRTVAVIGPPNSGKSTLFNRLTGMRQKVANYPGVTVEQRMGRMAGVGRDDLVLIDLPGIYSLDPYSEDARVAIEVLRGRMAGTPKPDAVLLVLDSQHLTRQLMLAAPVLALGVPTLVLLNMTDLMEARGGRIDALQLARQLGAPVALISAVKGTGIEAVPLFLHRQTERSAARPLQLPVLGNAASAHQWAAQVSRQAGYRAPVSVENSRKIDNVLLHRLWGPLLFLIVVVGVFEVVFSIGQPLSDGFGDLLARAGELVRPLLPSGWLQSLVLDGAWKGIASVLVFLPQILLLFLFIGILEDSGYLARAALIADRVMRTIGLNGKAFIPLLSAYACAVPAIMSTRTIENKRDRIATILIAPFMTCSARFPVYLLVIAAFIPSRPLFGWLLSTRAAAMLGLYALGFLVAVGTARLLKSSILKSGRTPFLLEMPSYRWPTFTSLGLRLLDRAKVFLVRAGTIILLVTVVLWIMSNVPFSNGKPPDIANSLTGTIGRTIEPVIRPLGFNWKIGVGLITAVFSRETIIATMGTIYGMDPKSNEEGLQAALQHDLTLGGAVALLIFFAFAMQCISTIAVVRRETGGWKWPILQFSYMTVLAYAGAFAAFHLIG